MKSGQSENLNDGDLDRAGKLRTLAGIPRRSDRAEEVEFKADHARKAKWPL
jgi:hypothetical protein